LLKKIISSFFTKGSVAIINLIVLIISSRQLGGEVRGQVSLLLLNITVIQIINEIYTGYALVYFIPKFSVIKVYLTGLLWTFICISLLNAVFYVFNIGSRQFSLHVAILSFIYTLHSFHCVLILGKEKIRPFNFLVFFQPALLLLILSISIFYSGIKTLSAYLLALYISYTVSLLASLLFVTRLFREKKQTPQNNDPAAIFKNGVINQLGNLSHTLSNRFNFYMIGSAALIGVYSSATSLIESVWVISGSVSPIVLTYIANSRDPDSKGKLTFLLCKLSFLLSLVCVLILILLPENFYTGLLGKDFSGTRSVMMYLSPGILFISFSVIISHYFSGLGKQKILLFANVCGVLVTICTSGFLIKNYGLIGACCAASLSYFVASLILVILFLKHNQMSISAFFSIKEELKELLAAK
jgi:O-antigen/teichoic acid export membrane protein